MDAEKTSPLVSIIVPVYNCEAFVQQCLDSVYAQTYHNWELVCIDDGSDDASLSILKENETADDRVRVVAQQNSGPGIARNKGIELARGEFILFLDADDFASERLLELAVARAIETDADLVVWDVWFYNDRHCRQQHPPVGILYFAPFAKDGSVFSWRTSPDDVLLSFQNWPWNKLFKTSFVKEQALRFQENVMRTEDVMFVCSALVKAERMAALGERLSYYRVMRSGSAMDAKDKYALDFLVALLAFKKFLEEENLYQAVEKSYINWALSSTLYNLHTLKSYDSFYEVYDHLKEKGFRDLGLTAYRKDDFTNLGQYDSMRSILTEPITSYLYQRMRMLDDVCEDRLALFDFADTDSLDQRKVLETELERAAGSLKQEHQKTVEALAELRKERDEFDEIMNAAEQKIGSAICFVPRALQRKLLARPSKRR